MGTVNVTLGEDARLNLILGQQLENAVTSVVFDFSAWQTAYGSGTLALSVQRPGDEQPYAVTLTTSGTDATWSVTDLDTAYKGVGHIQLTYTVGSAIKKSVVYKFTVYESLGANGEYPSPGQTWQQEIEADIADVKQDLQDLIDSGGGGLSAEFKQALHNIFEKVAYIDGNGQDYLDALDDAMSSVTAISLNTSTLSFSSLNSTQQLVATTTPAGGAVSWASSNTSVATVSSSGVVTSVGYGTATITASAGSVSATCSVVVAQATLVSISCGYTQSGIVYESTSLDSLKDDLVVTATWDNSTTTTVASTDYELSGTLTVGTSTITVTYGGKTTTFSVTVTSSINYVPIGNPTITDGILSVEDGKYVITNTTLSPSSGQSWKIRTKIKFNTVPSGYGNVLSGAEENGDYAKTFILQVNNLKQLNLYISADKSNWTVSNKFTTAISSFSTDTWYCVETGYDGTNVFTNIYENSWDGTLRAYMTASANVLIYNGCYVGFGTKSTTPGFDGLVDLSECKIYVNDSLIWQALAA